MARTPPSPVDVAVIKALAERDLHVSAAQLERWRTAGLLPPYPRRWLGRGRGSVAEATREHVEIAAMLADHAGQGRDLRWAVLGWFRASRLAQPQDGTPLPQPPMGAVREALIWAVQQLPVLRLLSMSAQARTEEQVDAFYAYAEDQRRQWGRPHFMDPEEVRRCLLSGEDVPADAASHGAGVALIQLGAAAGLGGQEVGADVLAEALADSGLMPEVSRETWKEVLTKAELEGRPLLPEGLVDPLMRVQQASDEDLVKAHETALLLAWFGSLLVMNGLLLPRTPGLEALFGLINELGVGQGLIGMAAGSWKPQGFAQNLAFCLDPYQAWLCDQLITQIEAGPPLFRRDDGDTADAFMQHWMTSMKQIAAGSGRDASS